MKFHAGDDFSLDKCSLQGWSGRSVEVDSDQIETLIENNQCSTMQEMADILKISKSIKLLVKIKNVCLLFYGKNLLVNGLFGQPKTTLVAQLRRKGDLALFLVLKGKTKTTEKGA